MQTKKDLKEAYKQQKPVVGVFQIRNKETGRVLIEESTNIQATWNRNKAELRFGTHRNKPLQSDWNAMGEEQFEFSVLSELKIKEGDTTDVKKEILLLKAMVEEDLNIGADMRY